MSKKKGRKRGILIDFEDESDDDFKCDTTVTKSRSKKQTAPISRQEEPPKTKKDTVGILIRKNYVKETKVPEQIEEKREPKIPPYEDTCVRTFNNIDDQENKSKATDLPVSSSNKRKTIPPLTGTVVLNQTIKKGDSDEKDISSKDIDSQLITTNQKKQKINLPKTVQNSEDKKPILRLGLSRNKRIKSLHPSLTVKLG